MSVSDLLNLAEADVSAHEVAAECIETFLHVSLSVLSCPISRVCIIALALLMWTSLTAERELPTQMCRGQRVFRDWSVAEFPAPLDKSHIFTHREPLIMSNLIPARSQLALDAATCTRCNASRLAHSAPSRRMQGVFQYVDDSEEQRKVLQHVIESSLQSSMTLLTMGYVNRQPSYTSTRAEDNLSWEALDEPPPCEGDSWARVALDVKVRTPKVAITIDDKPGSGRRAGARPSRSRRQSAAGPTSQSSRRGGRSRPSSALSPEAGASESEAAGPSGATRQTPAEDIPRVRGSKKERERPQGGGDDMEARLRKELELRRQAEMAAKRAAQRQEEEKAQLKAMKKELRGRDYTYDFRGEVMLLTRVDGDRLPSAMLTPVRLRGC